MRLDQLQEALRETLAAHREVEHELPPAKLYESTRRIADLRAAIGSKIAEGANPCPTCGGEPFGLAHASERGTEYEVGCRNCGWFRDVDAEGNEVGRDHSARGRLPRHAAETWNEGPTFWQTKSKAKLLADGRWEKMPEKPAALREVKS